MGSLFWGEVILGICEGGKCRRLDVRRRLREKIRRVRINLSSLFGVTNGCL